MATRGLGAAGGGLAAAAAAASAISTWVSGGAVLSSWLATAASGGQTAWVVSSGDSAGARAAQWDAATPRVGNRGPAQEAALAPTDSPSRSSSVTHVEAGSFCGSSRSRASAAVTFGLVTLLAAPTRRRRRKVPPGSAPRRTDIRETAIDDLELDSSSVKTRRDAVEEEEEKDLTADFKNAFAVSDEDRRRRRMKKLIAKSKKPEELADYALDEILDKYEDPAFLGLPFIWVQLGHVILGLTCIIAAVASGTDTALQEFALFDLQGPVLEVVKNGIGIAYSMNFLLAVLMYVEESSLGDDRQFKAAGWAIKAVILGGVAFWQRDYKLQRAKAKMEKDKQLSQSKDVREKNMPAPVKRR